MRDLALGARTLWLRPRLLLGAWLLHLGFAVAASWYPWREIIASLEHRPVASRAFLQGFDLELLADWLQAYGKPMAAYQGAAVMLVLAYGLAVVLWEAVAIPAWLWPFEHGRNAFEVFPAVLQSSIGGFAVWLMLAGAILGARPAVPKLAAIAGLSVAVILRVILNLWKCARVSGKEGLGDAVLAVARHPGDLALLAGATLAATLIYGAIAAAAGWYALTSAHVLPALCAGQGVLLTAVLLRLWLLASAVVFWRRTAVQSG